jgi:hypothetical protein
MTAKKSDTADEVWKAAQAALEAARQLPVGAKRVEAPKRAGQLRYDADEMRTREAGGNAKA